MATITVNGVAQTGATIDEMVVQSVVGPTDTVTTKITSLKLSGVVLPVPEPLPPSGNDVLIFATNFDSMSGLTNNQFTGGGTSSISGGIIKFIAPNSAKAEVGSDLSAPIQTGQVCIVRGRFRVIRPGNTANDLYVCDIESSRAAGGGDSEPGPRLCRKNGVWAIEQQKFSGNNIRSTKQFAGSTWSEFEWRFLYDTTAGWHELIVDGQRVISPDTTNSRGKTGPGSPLDRGRCGITINPSGSTAELDWDFFSVSRAA